MFRQIYKALFSLCKCVCLSVRHGKYTELGAKAWAPTTQPVTLAGGLLLVPYPSIRGAVE